MDPSLLDQISFDKRVCLRLGWINGFDLESFRELNTVRDFQHVLYVSSSTRNVEHMRCLHSMGFQLCSLDGREVDAVLEFTFFGISQLCHKTLFRSLSQSTVGVDGQRSQRIICSNPILV